MRIHFVAKSSNRKTGPIAVTYSERETCPPSCPHYRADCYAEDYYTRMTWDRVGKRGGSLDDLCESVARLPAGALWRHNVAGDLPGVGESVDTDALDAIVRANTGRRGWTYTHKRAPQAIDAVRRANAAGFVVNLSADDAGDADTLAALDAGPVVVIVPMDSPEKSATPAGRPIVVCPAQTRDEVTCADCGLCARSDRRVIVGFRAHGTRARVADAKARRVIPITKS